MNQPESDRATTEDYAWIEELARKCEAGENHGDIGYRVVWNARYRRILNSLRAPLRAPAVPVADRERLARALFIFNRVGGERYEQEAARTWDEEPDTVVASRLHYRDEADRMLRILGGFPVATERRLFALSDSAGFVGHHSSVESARDAAERLDGRIRWRQAYDEGPIEGDGASSCWRIEPACQPLPAPVVQKEPRAWEWSAEGRDGKTWRVVTMDRETAEHWEGQQDFIGTVTPLYALETTDG